MLKIKAIRTGQPGIQVQAQMQAGKKTHKNRSRSQADSGADLGRALIEATASEEQCLDAIGLNRLEESFREWAAASPRQDVRVSRRRILLIFLLIRYTAAKLKDVLALDPFKDIDLDRSVVKYGSASVPAEHGIREIQISEKLSLEIKAALKDRAFRDSLERGFDVDPAFVRKKFYERAEDCGFPKRLAGPEVIRKARAVELMQGNAPFPVVQSLLGQSTPNLTSSYVSFSADEIQQAMRIFVEKESSRKTSARNSFFGKITAIKKGDIQSRIDLVTISGHTVSTIITNDSLKRLNLGQGQLITAEVKAPWVLLHSGQEEFTSSAENRFQGVITQVRQGKITTEYTVQISDGEYLCALVSADKNQVLSFKQGEQVWALFNCFAVVLHTD